MEYDPRKIELKWQEEWEKKGLHEAEDFGKKPKRYIMVEFPYPSGDGLHVGHTRSYVALDALARKKRMEGFNVLYPIGWDAFGLPTENYAIKTGVHPRQATDKNIKTFKRQIKSIGLSFDWSREIDTTDPKYYKWTQWIFLKFFEKGLAYQAEIPINWCPNCKTGLANEEVVQGKCERCGAETERRKTKQWMLKITEYANKLLEGLEEVDYSDRIKNQQINWIGRSEGVKIEFRIKNLESRIKVFTTRADTIFGVTAIMLAPEHSLVEKITTEKYKEEVNSYIKQAKKKSELERTSLEKEKTGAFTGSYCVNPVNDEKIPIWIGDYVVATYGGGAVMVVPAHDKRDYQFAMHYNLPIREVVISQNHPSTKLGAGTEQNAEPRGKLKEAFVDYGVLVNSGEFSGLNSKEAIEKISNWLEKKKLGKKQVQYKLRDWVFSRQHYWGEPIPIIHCKKCGMVPVPYEDLPVELPYVEKYQPTDTGESPLANIKDWIDVKCPKCKESARRETDTMPNWAGSSWYFLRYIDPKNNKVFSDNKKLKYWLPVDLYNGGMEHTTLHLLYSRFWHRFLHDLKIVPTKEPYAKRRSHGVVLGEDGRKMSKSFGNVINPDDIIEKLGADSLRLYIMFMGPFGQTIAWSSKGLEGSRRFIEKVWRIFNDPNKIKNINGEKLYSGPRGEKLYSNFQKLIKKTGEDLEMMKFNTAVAAFMKFINLWAEDRSILSKKDAEIFLKILAPFTPHITEELWRQLGNKDSIHSELWPQHNPKGVKEAVVALIIQVNGKVRDKIQAPADISEKEAKELALNREKVKKWIEGREVKKMIFVKGRLVNIVI